MCIEYHSRVRQTSDPGVRSGSGLALTPTLTLDTVANPVEGGGGCARVLVQWLANPLARGGAY